MGDQQYCYSQHTGQRLLASCSAKNELRLFSFAGKQLASVDAAGLHNHMAAISLDGRFFAAATFTSDVKVRPAHHPQMRYALTAAAAASSEPQGLLSGRDF